MGRDRIAVALAGGGPLGGIYELGALVALDEVLIGVDLTACDSYVGVSSGSLIAAGLANGITPRAMHRMFIESEAAEDPFEPEILLRPAFGEYARRLGAVLPLVLDASWHYLSSLSSRGFFESFARLSQALPTGLFDNRPIDDYLRRLFSMPGRSNDFRELPHQLYLVATDLDSGASVPFGAPGFDHVPISTAVQASAALPGLYPPVEIDGHYYVDGALRKTLHASVALRHGAKLVLCINPLVPFDADLAIKRGHPKRHKLVEGGLPVVLSQTFRAIIHSRMQVGMATYGARFKDADVVLFEPDRDDTEMFFTNVFSYAGRRRLAEHAYQRTRAELSRRADKLAPVLARHGVRIDHAVLANSSRSLLARPGRINRKHARKLGRTLLELDMALDRLESRQQARR
ncbi:MAG: patatin family protein [Rhodocyclaceae bacterium]|nr:MAG: patatin family protein [Rhodocyclaceae bacterium]